jgi:hypothetical protein
LFYGRKERSVVMKPVSSWLLALLLAVAATSCGDEGGEQDTDVEDLAADDGQGDGDASHDPTVDPLPDDGAGEDAEEDHPGDTQTDGTTACEEAGGYCTTFPVIPDAVVECQDHGSTHYWPAPPADRAMGCTVEGEGAGPWCCLPHEVTDPSDCEEAGGECYPDAGEEEDTCPMGWVLIRSACNGEDLRCCAPDNG